MYSKEEAYQIKKKFWISLGQYMSLQLSSEGTKVNWLNYKTGIKDLYFRVDVDNRSASVFIEISPKDLEVQQSVYEKFEMFEAILKTYLEEEWIWNSQFCDDLGRVVSIIGIKLDNVSVFRESDWNQIISFFKIRLQALDRFWNDNKVAFEI